MQMDKTKLLASVNKKLIMIKKTIFNLAKKLKNYTHNYYTFFSIIVFVIVGDILYFNTSLIKNIFLSDLTIIFSTLISLNISLFALSITVFAFILKLTDGKIIGRYIQEDIEINRICGSFISSFIFIIVNYFILFSLDILINLLIELFLLIPLILTIIFLLKNVIFRILPATTLDRSLNFFTDRLEQLKKEFQKEYKKIQKKTLKLSKKQKIEIKNLPKIRQAMKSERYLSFTFTRNFLNQYVKEYSNYHRDAISLLIEIQEKTKSSEPRLYTRIGRAIVPPHINYDDFIQKNVIIPIKEIHEKFPKFSNCYLYYLEGYITEMFKSEFFDDTMLANIEQILPYIQDIGYKNEDSTSSNLLFDKTNDIFYRIAKLISEYKIDEQNLSSTNIRDRVMRSVARIIKENRRGFRPRLDKNAILMGTTLSRLRDLIKLEIPFGIKKTIIDDCMYIVNGISRNTGRYYVAINIFSIFQDIWDEIITEDIILKSQRYVRSYVGYITELVSKYTSMAFSNTIRNIESDNTINNPYFLRQVNRIFINLVYRLKYLYNSTKNELVQNTIINICQNVYNQLIQLGTKFEQDDHQFNIQYYIGCPIIVGSLFLSDPPIKDGLNNLDETLNRDFGILCLFGIKLVINELFDPKPEYNNTFDELIIEKIKLVKSFFLKPTIQAEEYMKNPQGLPSMWEEKHMMKFRGSIEDRQGSERFFILGNLISQIIISILIFISNQEKINNFLQKHFIENNDIIKKDKN